MIKDKIDSISCFIFKCHILLQQNINNTAITHTGTIKGQLIKNFWTNLNMELIDITDWNNNI